MIGYITNKDHITITFVDFIAINLVWRCFRSVLVTFVLVFCIVKLYCSQDVVAILFVFSEFYYCLVNMDFI